MDSVSGTFVVTHVDDEVAILQDVESARVLTVVDHPEFIIDEAIRGTLESADALETTWTVSSIDRRWAIEVTVTDLEPTRQALEVGAGADPGTVQHLERAGSGEVHVLTVGGQDPEAAAADIRDDPATIVRAARLEAVMVEIRWDEADGIVSVRYLPD